MWCEPVEARMGSIAIVVDAPGLDDLAGMAVAREQTLVEMG